ncbi:MAG: DUF805 domain-containing protein [Oribacterium sp.]|nr:DUF805 domain-containing protein [Oribacterium sp.]
MSFTEAIRSVLSNYKDFNGRARRSEFWWYYLFECIVNFSLSGLSHATGIKAFVWGIYVFNVVLFIPGLALLFRRMHDTGKSAWLLLPCIIPVIGQIFMMLWFLKDSQPGENRWGPSPKGHL